MDTTGISNYAEIILTTADPVASLEVIRGADISLRDVRIMDEITLCVSVPERKVRELEKLLVIRGVSVERLSRHESSSNRKRTAFRPLMILVFLLLFVSIFLSGRVLFISVDGNTQVSAKAILESAEQCGIYFGASRKDVRSEQVKNLLLKQMPQLEWAGVNTYGCRAVICVKERVSDMEPQAEGNYSGIVAVCDGIVVSATTTEGTLLCSPGDAVAAGQLLISGYTDTGLVIRVEKAQGEIYAQTQREFTVVSIADSLGKGEILGSEKKYRLLIGKKHINFWKGSGISDAGCDRMYKEYYVTLPGGFQLPLGIGVETQIFRNLSSRVSEPEPDQMSQFSRQSLLRSMIAGKIMDAEEHFSADKLFVLNGRYICEEMIGIPQKEQIGDLHG